MKSFLKILFALFLITGLAACGEKSAEDELEDATEEAADASEEAAEKTADAMRDAADSISN